MFLTEQFAETRTFYLETLGVKATHDVENYIQVCFSNEEGGAELCFSTADDKGSMSSFSNFSGEGAGISVPVDDVNAYYKTLQKRNVEILSAPSKKPWGWTSFSVKDPSGLVLDFFQEGDVE
ncbi:MAG: hypothetical protein GY822_17655 [Deltaproteobacteria bacterium]|nr:hypothetical protein [Deltaproteobacteria bacterium]